MGDCLYNLLFGYDINDRYIEKNSQQFGINFTTPCRVGIIVADRKYGINLEQDEHIYEYYTMRRKTLCFSYGDIRRVHRIYASN